MSTDKSDEDSLEALEIRLLLEAIAARWGYDLREYAAPSLRRRILAALGALGAPHLGELQHRIIHEHDTFARLIDNLMVGVTELFRDPALYLALRADVVPLLRTYPFLKIWHAGCSSGEEAYSSAILLQEEGLSERTQIYATDLSQRAIEHGKEGLYPASDLLSFARNHRAAGGISDPADWITAAYDHVAMRDVLRKQILFFQHDLVSDRVFGEMHVVFCRNVLIYFTPQLRRRVLDKFAETLCPGGFLCLGSSEQLSGSSADPRFVPFRQRERIYRYEP